MFQSRPNVKGMVGNAKLIGRQISYNGERDKILSFLTNRGSFTYNVRTDEFKKKFQVC